MFLAKQIVLGFVGLSAGLIVAGGLVAFVTELGIVSDLADRTHTGKHVTVYEDAISLGGILGNLVWIYQISLKNWCFLLPTFGLLAGIFTGCWAIALAELLDVFPVLIRRIQIRECIPWAVLGIALGKMAGAGFFFLLRW